MPAIEVVVVGERQLESLVTTLLESARLMP
jgi:hypothetical protein